MICTWYGCLATATCLPGGWLADRFSTRKLLTFSFAGSDEQGKFFSLLEGWRGLASIIGAAVALWLFNIIAGQSLGAKSAIWVKAGGCLLAAALTWVYFKDPVDLKPWPSLFTDISATSKPPLIRALSLIIFCCYAAFTAGSYMTPYLTDILGAAAGLAVILTVLAYINRMPKAARPAENN